MPRLFTALDVPDPIRDSLSMLRGGLPGARWIDPDNYHVTLRFIGDVGDHDAREIAAILGRGRRGPITLRITGIGAFGGKRPRAIVASIDPAPALMELQAEHERLVHRLGFEPESRKYTPHVTLARLRDASSRQVADYLSMSGGYRSMPFTAERFELLSSRDSVGGGPYVTEAIYPLTATGQLAMAGAATR